MIGPTRGGKTYLTAAMLEQLRAGPRVRNVVLIDTKGEYETLPSNVVRGEVIADQAELEGRPHYWSHRCWCDDFHRDQPTTLRLGPPPYTTRFPAPGGFYR